MKKYTNREMDEMMESVKPLLERTDIIGYAAARNTRILQSETVEYMKRRDELVQKYGEPEFDDEGNQTGKYMMKLDSQEWRDYSRDIADYAAIEHEPVFMKIDPKEVIGVLSGSEILAIDWMLKDEDEATE